MEIVSLGSNCAVAYQLKKIQIRNQAYPFDWAKVSLNSLITVLENNFDRYSKLSIKKISQNHLILDNTNTNPTYIVTNNYGITMAHELVNEEQLNLFELVLLKRIDRFIQLKNMADEGKIIRFVRIEISNLSPNQMLSYNKLVELLDKIISNYQIVVISKNKPDELNPKITWYELKAFDKKWWYPEVIWENIFNL